jgi:hypothetical protein
MSSAAIDIATLLQTEGAGTLGTDIFVGEMPEQSTSKGIPHRCLAVLDSGGRSPNPRWDRDDLSIQVLIRSSVDNYVSGYNYAYEVKDSLLGHTPVTINGSLYSLFVLEGDINSLGSDSSGRARFTLNFRIVRDNFTGSSREDL